MKLSKQQIDDFNRSVKKGSSCWLWVGGTSNGAGTISIGGKRHKPHRIAYEMWVGKIPVTRVVYQRCRNKLCVNPKHLYTGSLRDHPDAKAWKKGHPPIRSISERFWEKVDKDGPIHPTLGKCWVWTSLKGFSKKNAHKSYGQLSVKEGQESGPHRISWIFHNGSIPDNQLVLHKCDNRKCVNPEHLFLGDQQDNMTDMVVKGRSLKGEKSPMAKLTEKQVLTIRMLYTLGGHTQSSLAKKFKVNQTLIGFIVRRVSWKHI